MGKQRAVHRVATNPDLGVTACGVEVDVETTETAIEYEITCQRRACQRARRERGEG